MAHLRSDTSMTPCEGALEAYGVSRGKWPKDWPELGRVIAELDRSDRRRDICDKDVPLDLSTLKDELDDPLNEKISPARSLLNEPAVSLNLIPILKMFAVIGLCVVVAAVVPAFQAFVDRAKAFLAGCTFIFLAMLTTPLIRLLQRTERH